MARNGAGTHAKLAGSIAVPSTVVDSSDYNDQIDDIVASLNDTLLLNGVKPMAANLAMGTNKVTGLGSGTAATDAVALSQVQTGIVQHSTAVAGTADAIQITLSPTSATLTTNEVVRWKSGGANTITAPTLSKDAGVTNKTIKKGASAALAVGDTGASGYECEALYNGTDWILQNPVPSTFSAASTTEILTGTDTTKFATADSIAALWEQGADVASAGVTSLGEGGYFNITGTTTITDIDFATDKTGRRAWLKFAGILTLTHNASTLILPGGVNITTAAGDTAEVVSEGSDVIRVLSYNRASGLPIVNPTVANIPVTIRKATQDTRSSNVATNDTDFTFSMLANTNYLIKGRYFISCSSGTTGCKIAISGPASPNSFLFSTRFADVNGTFTAPFISISASVSSFSITQTAGASSDVYWDFEVVWRNGANAGTFVMQTARQHASAGNATFNVDSEMTYVTF